MSVAVRLGVFAAGLVVVFVAAMGIGRATGPVGPIGPAPTPVHDGHGGHDGHDAP